MNSLSAQEYEWLLALLGAAMQWTGILIRRAGANMLQNFYATEMGVNSGMVWPKRH